MYLIGVLPNHIIVFKYGKRLTKKRKQKAAEKLLEFARENYCIPKDHLTLSVALKTIENETRFGKYKTFERTGRGGFRTESWSGVNQQKPIKEFNIE